MAHISTRIFFSSCNYIYIYIYWKPIHFPKVKTASLFYFVSTASAYSKLCFLVLVLVKFSLKKSNLIYISFLPFSPIYHWINLSNYILNSTFFSPKCLMSFSSKKSFVTYILLFISFNYSMFCSKCAWCPDFSHLCSHPFSSGFSLFWGLVEYL